MPAFAEGILDVELWLKLAVLLCIWLVEYTIINLGLYLPYVNSAGSSMPSCPVRNSKPLPSAQMLAKKTIIAARLNTTRGQDQFLASKQTRELASSTRIAAAFRLVTAPPHLPSKSSPWGKRGRREIPPVEPHLPIPRLPHHHNRW